MNSGKACSDGPEAGLIDTGMLEKGMEDQREIITLTGTLPELRSIGISIWDPVYARQEHVGLYWEVVQVIKGDVRLRIGEEVFCATSGDTLIVPARTKHRDEFPLDSEFEVLHIMFEWEDCPTLFPAWINSDFAVIPKADKQKARELAFETYDCFKRRRPMWQPMTSANLYNLLLYLHSAAWDHRNPIKADESATARKRHAAMIRDAKAYMKANLARPITLPDIASHLGISAYHLSHIFSKESGFTLSSWLIKSRLEKAAELLRNPGMNISETAYSVGFEDPNYFGKSFRRHFGCSPLTYRARILKSSQAPASTQ